MKQDERIMSAAQQLTVISGRPSARCCGSMSAACAACTGCWTAGLGRRESTESTQTKLSAGFDGSWAQAFASIGGCATARWDVPRPACCDQRELLRFNLRVHCSQGAALWFSGRMSDAGAPKSQLTGMQRRSFCKHDLKQDS